MVKCLECGFEADRLQWTHFRYKCTGRFKNGQEYQKHYPGAVIIDKALAKRQAITLENLILKYGETEGNSRWNSYREKQAVSNTYDYKKARYGWSREQFDEYNSSRAQTLKKMIQRHGEEEGAKRWESYCNRQAYTNTQDYFVEKYGLEAGKKKYQDINRRKAVSNPEYLAEKMGISIDEAVTLILARSKTFFSSNIEKEFILMLEEQIGKLDHSSINKPFGKWSYDLDTYVVYDIKHKNCIIEFNGDYWHANPNIYKETAYLRQKRVGDIWKRDKLKIKTVEDLGFRVLVVWESEFQQNKMETIKRVCEWILNEQK